MSETVAAVTITGEETVEMMLDSEKRSQLHAAAVAEWMGKAASQPAGYPHLVAWGLELVREELNRRTIQAAKSSQSRRRNGFRSLR